jgi:hypothetical protein
MLIELLHSQLAKKTARGYADQSAGGGIAPVDVENVR